MRAAELEEQHGSDPIIDQLLGFLHQIMPTGIVGASPNAGSAAHSSE
jgi:hypothetical protein